MSHLPESGAPIVPGLSILHANHPEDLRELVLMHLRSQPLRPLENELFLVQSNGMAQWLRQRFAEDDGCGIAAAMDMQMPARFLWQAYRAVLGEEKVPAESPFDKDWLTWRLLRLLPECLEDSRFASLNHYLADATDLSKRYQLAERLADLFDQYQVYRADWLADWAAGLDQLRDVHGQAQPLGEKMLWQAELWRRVLADVPENARDSSRAAVHWNFLQTIRSGAKPVQPLPRRIIVFGISSLPTQILEALEAISRFSQIFICVHNPCRYYWADIIEERQLLRFERHRHGIRSDLAGLPEEQLHAQVNPLLAAWGKQGRDYIGLLYAYDQARESTEQIDVFRDRLDPSHPTLLHMIQQGILDLAPVPRLPQDRTPVSPSDDSIRINLAYSRQREVEILQDHLLDLFNQDGSGLQPRDIIVMVPDITSYAPHIEAVFGRLERDDPRYIPYTIADRPERGQSQVLLAIERLLALPESRFTASDLMNLLDITAFRNRFGLLAEDLPLLQRWIQASGIRWGLHASHRAGLELPDSLEQNSWQFGLRRMLLGYANGKVAWKDVEPYDDLGGLESAIAGRLARVLEVLNHYWRQLCEPREPADWVSLLQELVADCLQPTESDELLLLDRFTDLLGQWLEACEQARLHEKLPLNLVREALLANFEEAGLSQRFLAGMVNFCTLMPMRSIPFQVVCLLGMNDGDYPRQRPPMDFDLMAENYRPGDRTRREDDRYLFLEALLAAREQLYISYIGRSERDNSERTPSVLVAQLCDHIDKGWRLEGEAEDARKLVAHLKVQHPLQPFSQAYFHPQRDKRLFSYGREWRQIHEEAAHQEDPAALAPWQPAEPLNLNQLQRFLRQPSELFFRERLNVHYQEAEASVEEHEPFLLDDLQKHELTRELVEEALQAPEAEREILLSRTLQRFIKRGLLPLGAQADRVGQSLLDPARKLVSHWAQACHLWPYPEEAQEIRLELATDSLMVRVEDWLGELYRDPQGELVRLERRPSQLYRGKKDGRALVKYHYFTGLWVRHLAANASGLDMASVLVVSDGLHKLPPLPREQALAHLVEIASAWYEGLQSCLPLALKTAFAWLDEGEPEDELPESLREAYEGGYNRGGERDESYALRRCWPSLEELWNEDFRRLSRQVYGPLHQALQGLETISDNGARKAGDC